MREIPQLSESEYEVMKVVWKYEPISTPEVVKKLSNKSDWKAKCHSHYAREHS